MLLIECFNFGARDIFLLIQIRNFYVINRFNYLVAHNVITNTKIKFVLKKKNKLAITQPLFEFFHDDVCRDIIKKVFKINMNVFIIAFIRRVRKRVSNTVKFSANFPEPESDSSKENESLEKKQELIDF